MARVKWRPTDEELQRIEELARMGLSERAIARQLRICRHTLIKRKKEDASLAFVLKRARQYYLRGFS